MMAPTLKFNRHPKPSELWSSQSQHSLLIQSAASITFCLPVSLSRQPQLLPRVRVRIQILRPFCPSNQAPTLDWRAPSTGPLDLLKTVPTCNAELRNEMIQRMYSLLVNLFCKTMVNKLSLFHCDKIHPVNVYFQCVVFISSKTKWWILWHPWQQGALEAKSHSFCPCLYYLRGYNGKNGDETRTAHR